MAPIRIKEKSKELIYYLQTSEPAFLLIFSPAIGLGAGFGAIFFRWLIASFHTLFYEI